MLSSIAAVVLQCRVRGLPDPDKDIVSRRRLTETGLLVISKSTEEDTGKNWVTRVLKLSPCLQVSKAITVERVGRQQDAPARMSLMALNRL